MPEILHPYKHDCDKCIWVGWIHVKDGGKFGSDWGNMYFCPSDPQASNRSKHPGTVLIRFSDEPSDYWSSPIGYCAKGSLQIGDGVAVSGDLSMLTGVAQRKEM